MGAATSNTSGNNVIAVVAAIYTIVLCIIQICVGTAAGLVSGGLNQLTTAVTEAGGTVSGEVGQITGNGPREPVATAVVFDVRDDTAAAMVVKSVREVRVGDLAETRGGGRAGGAGGDAP